MVDGPVTFEVRVRPGAKTDRVGGTWGDDPGGPLNVWVSKPAVEGAANKATLAVLAEALMIRMHQLAVVRGHKSRIKNIRLVDPPVDIEERLRALRR